uniref:Uncharacterized protein n=1 Tax=Rhizophora mucronata TaxID=61149 RepID=A0A2P2PNH2_RHIMU
MSHRKFPSQGIGQQSLPASSTISPVLYLLTTSVHAQLLS